MVPFRSSRSSRSQTFNENAPNRTRTGQIDHDVFEGLPVRRWSRQTSTYSQAPKAEDLDTGPSGSQKLTELPMPRDSHLLTPMSRSLLRAARAGCTYIRPVQRDPPEIEGNDPKDDDAAEPSVYDRTFTATKWAALPRQLDLPEVEFLAKRRTGMSSLYGGAAPSGDGLVQAPHQPAPMRKTKFKKTDPATGHVSIYEAWVPEGHRVEGEITEESEIKAENPDVTVVAASPAPGTLIEGVGVVDQEGVVVAEPEASMVGVYRRRHPPPKRKAKGPGRGRGKKVVKFVPADGIARPAPPDNEAASDTRPGIETAPGQGPSTGIGSTDGQQDVSHEGEEEEDEDEDGDGSDEEEEPRTESKPAPPVEDRDEKPAPVPDAVTGHQEQTTVNPEETSTQPDAQQGIATAPPRDMSSSPDLPLAAAASTGRGSNNSKSPAEESKPILTPTPPQQTVSQDNTVPSPSKGVDPSDVAPPAEPSHEIPDIAMTTGAEQPTQPPAEPSNVEPSNVEPSTVEPSNFEPPNVPQPEETQETQETQVAQDIEQANDPSPKPPSPRSPKPATTATPPTEEPITHEQPPPSEPVKTEPSRPESPEKTFQTPVRFEDGEVDLLGSLEASLDRQTIPSVPQATEKEPDSQQADDQAPSAKEGSDVKDTEMTG